MHCISLCWLQIFTSPNTSPPHCIFNLIVLIANFCLTQNIYNTSFHIYTNHLININHILAVIVPYAECRRVPEESSPMASIQIDDITGERIYEEIPDAFNRTAKTECTNENII